MPPLHLLLYGRPLRYFDRGEVHEESARFWAGLDSKFGLEAAQATSRS
jgi:hypothetical protein